MPPFTGPAALMHNSKTAEQFSTRPCDAPYISSDASDADVAMTFKTNHAPAPVTTSETEPNGKEELVYSMETITGAEGAGDSDHDFCALARTLVNNLRSPLAAVRIGADLLIRSDLSPLQSRRVARNVIVAAARIEELLSDFKLRLIDARP